MVGNEAGSRYSKSRPSIPVGASEVVVVVGAGVVVGASVVAGAAVVGVGALTLGELVQAQGGENSQQYAGDDRRQPEYLLHPVMGCPPISK